MSHRSRHAAVALGLSLTVLAAACGSKSGADGGDVATLNTGSVGSGAVTTTTTAATTQDAMLAYVACLREQGLDVADPTFDATGNPTGGLFGQDSGIDPRSDEFRTAQEAWRGDLLQGVTFGGQGGQGFNRQEISDSLNDFTACLRDEGLDVDDIDFAGGPGGPGGPNGGGPNSSDATGASAPTGSGPQGGFGPPPGADGQGPGGQDFDPTARIIEQLGLDADDAAVKTAITACQSILDDAFTPPTTTTTN